MSRQSNALSAHLVSNKLGNGVRDGVLWITSSETAEAFLKTAVYDVRDLCQDESESDSLREAITSQTNPDSWDDVGGPGTVEFAQPGTLVISHQETVQMEVLKLLDTYRAALRISKPRARHALDPNEVITTYYRLHANVAEDLAELLPTLVQPDSWASDANPQAKGTVTLLGSPPDLFGQDGQLARNTGKNPAEMQALVVSRAVLIIHQTRAIHYKIAEVIHRIESGDGGGFGGGGMGLGGGAASAGGGGGGFGGGYFSIPSLPDRSK